MKHKLLYIIAMLITTACVIRFLAEIQSLRVENSSLTHQIQALQQDKTTLQSEVDKLTKENEQLKSQQTKEPEAQKSNRSAERPRYNLTDSERDLVERVVMAESGGESYEGQILVAQCILNACEIDGIRPAKVIKKYVYAKGRPKPTDSVVKAVMAVFDKGETVTDEAIVYFYAPKVVKSKFHESQEFVCEVGNHRFFTER